jgi:hypothetical protein
MNLGAAIRISETRSLRASAAIDLVLGEIDR